MEVVFEKEGAQNKPLFFRAGIDEIP